METDLSIKAEVNLYYDLHVPESIAGPSPLLIAVHGYGASKRYMMRESRLVAPDHWVIASVQGPHQHFRQTDAGYKVGFGWLTDHKPDESITLHHEFLLNLINGLVDRGLVDPSRIYLYGFSQSCALNFRFAFTHSEILAGLVGVCGGIPGDLDTVRTYRPSSADTLYLYGDEDEFYSLERFKKFDETLGAYLPSYRSRLFRAKHEIIDEMRDEIRAFLAQER